MSTQPLPDPPREQPLEREPSIDIPPSVDLSPMSHHKPAPARHWVQDLLIAAGGAHPAKLRAIAPSNEIHDYVVRGAVGVGTCLLTGMTLTIILHFASGARGFHILHAIVGILAAIVQALTDNVLQARAPLYEAGHDQLLRSALKLPDPVRSWSSVILKAVRIVQGAAIGLLAGTALILVAMAPGIENYAIQKFINDNRVAYVDATKSVDAAIAQAADDAKSAATQADQTQKLINRLRQDKVRVSGRSGTKNAAVLKGADQQIVELERGLASETARRDALKATLSERQSNRNAAIERYIETLPTYVPKVSGLSGALEAVAALAKDSWQLILLLVVFQITSLTLELGPLWVGSARLSSVYAAHVTLTHFIAVNKVGRSGARELEEQGARSSPAGNAPDVASGPSPANDNAPSASGTIGAAAQKNPVGRPKGSKNKPKVKMTNGSGLVSTNSEKNHDA